MKGRRREEFNGMKGSPRHGGEVERRQIGEFLKCDGFGEGVSGADLAVDLGDGSGDDDGLGGGVRAEGFDEIIEGALEEGVSEGGGGGEDGGGGGGGGRGGGEGGWSCHGGMEGTEPIVTFGSYRIRRVWLVSFFGE